LVSSDNLKAMGVNPDDAQKWSLGLSIGMMVAGAGAGLAGVVKSGVTAISELGSQVLKGGFLTTLLAKVGGQAAAAAGEGLGAEGGGGEDLGAEGSQVADVSGQAAEEGGTTSEQALDKTEDAANHIQRYAKRIEIAARVGSGATNVTAGGLAIDSGVDRRDADL